MDTSDDPIVTPILATLGGTATAAQVTATMAMATAATTASQAFGTGRGARGGFQIPSKQAEQAKKTAEPVAQLSEQAKKNKRLRASMLTRGWGKPKLGEPGLLGL